jgi:carbonic anhydrase
MHRLFVFLSFFQICVHARHWNYHSLGPDTWSDHYPLCAGQAQSPINILTSCTHYRNIAPFNFTSAYDKEHKFTVKNNGHTIVGTIEDHHRPSSIHLTGGGLNGTFDFLNFHLHWGENYKSGSEHHV